jgi:signal transduction histidine kinase/DNA-binding NarL/FixJ family response regulator
MAIDARARNGGRPRGREPAAALTAVVEDLAGELSLRPLLERILRRSTELLGCDAGSICLVDEGAGVYRKEADIGVACQSGAVFPLTEGVTGAVVARRGPVIFDDYGKVPGGHVRPEDRGTLKGVIGVPIWWRGDIVGSCVVFTRDPRRAFTTQDAELLELFAKHAAIAITNARLHEAAEANARAEAAAAERTRMAREVHDTIAQGLVSVLLQLRSAHGAIDGGRAGEAIAAIDEARTAAEAAFEETRRSVLGLAPSPLEGRSLEDALELELGWVNRTGVADVRLVTAGTPVPLPPDLAHTLFRIAQEALTNALRHARATSVRVGVVYAPTGVTLLVQDDGAGFDRSRVATGGGGTHTLGLKGMVERARLLGGTLELDSTPGWGTRVRASIPLPSGVADGDAPRTRPVRVLVADDHAMTRAGIVRLLSAGEPAMHVVGEAATGEEAVAAWRSLRPDVVLMDLQMPNGDGTEAIARIREEDPDASIVALTAFASDDWVSGALRAGARGYVGKDASEAELVGAVLAASRGGMVVSAPAADRLHAHLNGNGGLALTEREREVLVLLERGAPDREIASALGISVKTVEKHVGSILRKTGAHNRTQAVARAREHAAR